MADVEFQDFSVKVKAALNDTSIRFWKKLQAKSNHRRSAIAVLIPDSLNGRGITE